MKKIILITLILITSFFSCKNENPNIVSFSGKIDNIGKNDTLLTISGRGFKKDIKIGADGTFKDTMNVKNPGYYSVLINRKNNGFIFLRNGFDLKLKADNTSFLETAKYTGNGANTTNYLLAQFKFGRTLGSTRPWFVLEKDVFIKKIDKLENSFDSILKQYGEIDTLVLRTTSKQNKDFFALLKDSYDVQHERIVKQMKAEEMIAKGKPSPKFYNYINYKRGKSSLDAFKGKYVYIDVWATWCKPCIAQIPYLKKLEKKYSNKITFISISTDDASTAGSWDKAKAKWRKMVKDKDLTGVQLYAGQDLKFMQDYLVTGIPRFILLDPKGNIVDANAPRPTDPRLEVLFKELGI